jgi:tetratricopeptide (TPR) repeat protein
MLQPLCDNETLLEALQAQLPEAKDLWLAKGRSLALMSRWEEADAAYSRFDEPLAADDETWFELACVKLLAGNDAGYRKLLETLRERAGEQPEPFAAFILARIHGIAPQQKEIADQAVLWGEEAVAQQPTPWFVHALTLARIRAGQSEKAIKTLTQQLKDKTWSPFQNKIALALAYRNAGEDQLAQEWLSASRQWQAQIRNTAVKGRVNVPVIAWLPFHVLLQEAERK